MSEYGQPRGRNGSGGSSRRRRVAVRRPAVPRGGERRRPQRGLAERPRPRPRRSSTPVKARLQSVLRIAAVVAVLPAQLVALVLPSLGLRAGAPRNARRVHRRGDRESLHAAAQATITTSMHYVREEFADMRDGVPRPGELLDLASDAFAIGLRKLLLAVGLVDPDAAPRAILDRVHRAAVTGLVAGVAVVGLFLAAHGAVEAAQESEHLTLVDISVRGLDRLAEDDVLAALPAAVGDNLLRMPTDLAAALASHPWIAEAYTELDPATRSLTVTIVERSPALLLAGPSMQLVDTLGVVFKELGPGDPADLPLLRLAADGDAGDVSRAALELVRATELGRAIDAGHVSELRWDGPQQGFTLITTDGLPVRVGRRDFSARLSRLERAVAEAELPLSALVSVDVSMRDRLVAVPRAQKKHREQVRQRVQQQPTTAPVRKQVFRQDRLRHLDRIRGALTAEPFDWSAQ